MNQYSEGSTTNSYVFLGGLWLKCSWGGEVRNVSLLVAIGVNDDGAVMTSSKAMESKK